MDVLLIACFDSFGTGVKGDIGSGVCVFGDDTWVRVACPPRPSGCDCCSCGVMGIDECTPTLMMG